MIVRILGEGQLEVDDAASDELNVLDAALDKAVKAGDDEAFRLALTALLDRVRALGSPVAADSLASSDLILPYADADVADVQAMMRDDGLIPG
jgi:PspAA-like protein